MAIGVYFHPKSLSAEMYDEAVRQVDAAGARQPAGPDPPFLLRTRRRPDGLRGVGITAGLSRTTGPCSCRSCTTSGLTPERQMSCRFTISRSDHGPASHRGLGPAMS